MSDVTAPRLLAQLRGIAVDCAVDYHRKDGEWAQVFATVEQLEALAAVWMGETNFTARRIPHVEKAVDNTLVDCAAELRALLGTASEAGL